MLFMAGLLDIFWGGMIPLAGDIIRRLKHNPSDTSGTILCCLKFVLPFSILVLLPTVYLVSYCRTTSRIKQEVCRIAPQASH